MLECLREQIAECRRSLTRMEEHLDALSDAEGMGARKASVLLSKTQLGIAQLFMKERWGYYKTEEEQRKKP